MYVTLATLLLEKYVIDHFLRVYTDFVIDGVEVRNLFVW